jgi:isoamylase
VPMLLGGDEFGRTQRGNNNAYCQDNELSWFDWSSVDEDLLAFARGLISIRRGHPVLRRHRFASGALRDDIAWFTPTGSAMTDSDWGAGWTRSVVAYFDGTRDADRDEHGQPIVDDDLMLVVNGWWEPLTFTLPAVGAPRVWSSELDTATGDPGGGSLLKEGDKLTVEPRSLLLLSGKRPSPAKPARKPAAS